MQYSKRLLFWVFVIAFALPSVYANSPGDSGLLDDLSQVKRPPRNVQDVLRAIEASQVDRAEVDRARELAATTAPQTQDVEALHAFYRRRADAFQRIGKIDEAIRDMRRAAQEYMGATTRDRIDAWMDLGLLENRGGNIKNAISAYEQARSLITRDVLGYFMVLNRLLIGAYSQAGDFPSAEAALRDSEATMVILRKSPSYSTSFGPGWESNLESARATIYLFQGRWVEAERAGRLSLRRNNDSMTRYHEQQASKPDSPDAYRRAMKNYTTYRVTRQLDLAHAVMMQGRLVDAEILCREALDMTLKVFNRCLLYTSPSKAVPPNPYCWQRRPFGPTKMAERLQTHWS